MLLRPEEVDSRHSERRLNGRKGAIAGVGAFELLHDQAIGDGAEPRASIPLDMRAEDAKLPHPRYQRKRKGAVPEVRNDSGHRLRFHESPNRVAHLAFVVRQLRFDVQEINASIRLQRTSSHP